MLTDKLRQHVYPHTRDISENQLNLRPYLIPQDGLISQLTSESLPRYKKIK